MPPPGSGRYQQPPAGPGQAPSGSAAPASQADPTTAYPAWGAPDGRPPAWGGGHGGWSRPPAGPTRPQRGWSLPAASWWERLLGQPSNRTGPFAGMPPTYFWQSLVCLFLFLPTGVAAVSYSLLVTRRAGTGDGTGAVRASLLARFWCLASLVVFAVLLLLSAATGFPA